MILSEKNFEDYYSKKTLKITIERRLERMISAAEARRPKFKSPDPILKMRGLVLIPVLRISVEVERRSGPYKLFAIQILGGTWGRGGG